VRNQIQTPSQAFRSSHLIFILSVFLILLFFLFAQRVYSYEVTLAWDQNPETNLLGYKVYYKTATSDETYNGTGIDQGPSPITLLIEDLADPDNPEFTLTGLDDNEVYFFVVTAYNSYGESDYSDEVPSADLWSGAVDLGNGWKWLDWFGYFNVNSSPWIFHLYLGWLYADLTQTTSSIFFLDPVFGWIFTSDSMYPWLWWFRGNTWLFYLEGTVSPRLFYNVNAGAWQAY